jgi:hypothetical protein
MSVAVTLAAIGIAAALALAIPPLRDAIFDVVQGDTSSVREDLRDLGAAVGVRVLAALGGAVEEEGEALRVRLPLAPVVG